MLERDLHLQHWVLPIEIHFQLACDHLWEPGGQPGSQRVDAQCFLGKLPTPDALRLDAGDLPDSLLSTFDSIVLDVIELIFKNLLNLMLQIVAIDLP